VNLAETLCNKPSLKLINSPSRGIFDLKYPFGTYNLMVRGTVDNLLGHYALQFVQFVLNSRLLLGAIYWVCNSLSTVP